MLLWLGVQVTCVLTATELNHSLYNMVRLEGSRVDSSRVPMPEASGGQLRRKGKRAPPGVLVPACEHLVRSACHLCRFCMNSASVGSAVLGITSLLLRSWSRDRHAAFLPLIHPSRRAGRPRGSIAVWNSVWFLKSSSVHITQLFKESYVLGVFFIFSPCSCQLSLNIFWNLHFVTVGWKLA